MSTEREPTLTTLWMQGAALSVIDRIERRLAALEAADKVPEIDPRWKEAAQVMAGKVPGGATQPAPEAGRCDERCVGWCSAHIAKGGDPLMHRRAVQGQESDFMWPCPDWRCDGSGPAHQPAPAVTRESWLPAVGTVVGADLEAGTVTIEVDGGFVERGVHGGRVSISRLDAKIPA